MMCHGQYLNSITGLAVDHLEGKALQQRSPDIRLAFNAVTVRSVDDLLHDLFELRQIRSAEPRFSGLIERDRFKVFGFGRRVKAITHRNKERALLLTSSAGTSSTRPSSISRALCWAASSQS